MAVVSVNDSLGGRQATGEGLRVGVGGVVAFSKH